jgi:hypothetical protein
MIRYVPGQWNPSEVAQFLQKWETEAAAMKQGLQGLALGTAQHEFIVHNMDKALSAMPMPDAEPAPTTQSIKPCSPTSCSE